MEPTITQKGRTAEAIWTLKEENGEKTEAVLTVHHFGRPQYFYAASLRQQKRHTDGPFEVTEFWCFDSVSIYRTPSGSGKRFSANDQQTALTQALDIVCRLRRQGDPEVCRMFTPQERRAA